MHRLFFKDCHNFIKNNCLKFNQRLYNIDGDDVSICPSQIQHGATLKTHGTHCYEFQLHIKRDWKAAQGDCAARGGTLVVVNDNEEQTFLMSSLKSLSFHATGVWIGLSDTNQEGTFAWVTGSY